MKVRYHLLILALCIAAPFLMPNYLTELAMLWVMVVLSITWDTTGGQMGYNSFGNVIFFGVGMYACAKFQLLYPQLGYFPGLILGLGVGGLFAILAAAIFGNALLGMRGHYFSIGTLGLGIAAGEVAGGWDFIGAGSGLTPPLYHGALEHRNLVFYFMFFTWAALTFITLRWLYRSRFGLAINAIRDNEEKAEAMGIHTTRYKVVAWIIPAWFLGVIGGGTGNLLGFIAPKDIAFSGPTFGVWMILMAITGGKGTVWGPVIGAVVFHVTQELFWTYILGWQRVAMGLLIILIVLFFPEGIMGWLRQRYPERFAATNQTSNE